MSLQVIRAIMKAIRKTVQEKIIEIQKFLDKKVLYNIKFNIRQNLELIQFSCGQLHDKKCGLPVPAGRPMIRFFFLDERFLFKTAHASIGTA
jgi:hypothetical protein